MTAWQSAWQALGAQGDGTALRAQLWAAYAEPQRRYHTQQHLLECLHTLDTVREQVPEAAAVEIALWFHDAIYELQGKDNEARSAAWAAQALRDAGAPSDRAEQVRRLVLATRHQASPQAEDEAWLVDIDLAILGAAPARFAEYEAQIRAEYAFVPEALFKTKRAEVLRGFLARPFLFSTAHFRTELEARARANLGQALA
ncbi:HD domain-containing protein [Inhella proteolytica]|uniref:HD domain-containing protein n=1 Tax=Inhella proteolytica TaxID=2795029 RepID=UPI0028739313|nr:N-methyl-D-aspartate receptor NMDAR2C subunit [Inhella proteolytica]